MSLYWTVAHELEFWTQKQHPTIRARTNGSKNSFLLRLCCCCLLMTLFSSFWCFCWVFSVCLRAHADLIQPLAVRYTGWVKKIKLLILSEYGNKTEKIGGMWTNTNSYRESEALSDIFTWNILCHNCFMFKYSMTERNQWNYCKANTN